MNLSKNMLGHLAALLTILIWGTTFISTKILLQSFTPIEILFYRFMLGFVILMLCYPHPMKIKDKKHEIYFIAAGLCGITLYFLLENIALTYSFVSNVGVIIAVSPFFTAFLATLFLKEERQNSYFFIGFITAIIGIMLISFNGSTVLKLNPLGDILAVLAAIVWAIYSILTRKIGEFQYHTIQATRRTFFYGLLFMFPMLFIMDFRFDVGRFQNLNTMGNMLYLGVGASALCFVTWNYAVRALGAVKTSVYIYIVPVITVVTSALVLRERITGIAIIGTTLTLVGLWISEGKKWRKKGVDEHGLAKYQVRNDH